MLLNSVLAYDKLMNSMKVQLMKMGGHPVSGILLLMLVYMIFSNSFNCFYLVSFSCIYMCMEAKRCH